MVGALKISGAGKLFAAPDGQTVQALRDVDLNIEPGTFVTLIGPSGCGKSTLLRLIAGLDSPTDGELLLDEQKISGPGSDRGFVFQNHTLFPWLNIYDNIAFGLKVRKIYKKKKKMLKGL